MKENTKIAPIAIEILHDLLMKEVDKYVRRGYRVVSSTQTNAQLVKPKKFSLLGFFLLLGIFYLPFYVAKKDKTVFIRVESTGKIKVRKK